jgi:hypothetical protein
MAATYPFCVIDAADIPRAADPADQHLAQLAVYLRLLDRPLPPIYGPTADVSWEGADPTRTVDAARRS